MKLMKIMIKFWSKLWSFFYVNFRPPNPKKWISGPPLSKICTKSKKPCLDYLLIVKKWHFYEGPPINSLFQRKLDFSKEGGVGGVFGGVKKCHFLGPKMCQKHEFVKMLQICVHILWTLAQQKLT